MILHRIADWDDAYANAANIAGGDRWPALWQEPAAAFRAGMTAAGRASLDLAYGPKPRNRLDLFAPEGSPKGLVVYIHGGFWRAFDKSVWSHLAKGPLAHGYAVAMPAYTLCPEVRVGEIVREIAQAVGHAAGLVEGPIMLTGHSAGGHLATRMVTADSPLPPAVLARVRLTVSISGVHDLRPLMRTAINNDLRLDQSEAVAESPALLAPADNARLVAWVGGAERSEFIRQSALLANVWTGFGIETGLCVEPDRHHFTIVDGLADPDHALTRTLLTG